MKIGIVIDKLDIARGGQQVWVAGLAKKLKDRGDEVHVIAGHFDDALIQQLGIIAHRVHNFRSKIVFAKAIEKKLLALDLDVIHDTGNGWYCDLINPHYGSRKTGVANRILLLPPWIRPFNEL